jgi:hypothetical protein
MVISTIDPSASTPVILPSAPNTTTTVTSNTTRHNENNQPLSFNQAHQALNTIWRHCFAGHLTHILPPEVIQANLLPEANVPWGPDAHEADDELFRVYFQNVHGFTRVNDTLPSWASIMDFLHSLRVSLFTFSEPNLTDVAVNDSNKPYTSSELAQVLQIDAQHWEKLLFTSGGKLELTKCFFYIMYWQFSEDGLPQLTNKVQLPHKLLLKQGNDTEPTEIDQKDCPEAHKTLGVMKAPNRSQTGEIQKLKKKCKE